MENPYVWLLSTIVFLPALGAIILMFMPKDNDDAVRYFTLAITVAVFVLCVLVFYVPGQLGFNTEFVYDQANEASAYMQFAFNLPWIPSFDISYYMGIDGISFPLIMLTALVSMLAMGASWSITKHVKGYCILFLLLETGMLGVFLALDFFLFYVFWEVMLLPMYFLIGIWGGPRKEYAAIKFFLYTLAGSVLMLIAILMLYFATDVRTLAESDFERLGSATSSNWNELHVGPAVDSKVGRASIGSSFGERRDAQVVFLRGEAATDRDLRINITVSDDGNGTATYDEAENEITVALSTEADTAADLVAAVQHNLGIGEVVRAALGHKSDGTGSVRSEDSLTIAAYDSTEPVHSFNILAMSAMGQHTDLFNKELWGKSLQWWAFLLLFIGFVVKVPSVPVHTWLPDAHVEAPTPISMILAGILLKMGGYGIIRICYPICPAGGFDLAFFVCLLGVVSMVYGAFAALAQKDFKRMVAYSSVSHMGYVVLGLGVWSATAETGFNPYYWNMGVKGAMFQMIGHGISSAGMFFMVGVVYDRVHHRNLNEFGGLFGKMPVYTALSMGIFFAGLGLPGLCGFIGEVLVVLSVWSYSYILAVISAAVVILTAGYILWAIQRVYLGAEYKGPHEEALTPSNLRERVIGGALLVLAILFGVFPHYFVLRYMDSTIDRQVNELAAWTKYVKEPEILAAEKEKAAGNPKVSQRQAPDRRVGAALQNSTKGYIAAANGNDENVANAKRPASTERYEFDG